MRIEFDRGLVKRQFTTEWSNSGLINVDKLPEMMRSVLEQRRAMVVYIEQLHDMLDFIIEKNHCCDNPGCLTAECGSDHK